MKNDTVSTLLDESPKKKTNVAMRIVEQMYKKNKIESRDRRVKSITNRNGTPMNVNNL